MHPDLISLLSILTVFGALIGLSFVKSRRVRVISLVLITLVVCAALFVFSAGFDFTAPRVQQAVLAAIIVGLGWVVGFCLKELGAGIDHDARSQDVEKAIYAEVKAYLSGYQNLNIEEYGDEIREKILSDPTGEFTPFVPLEEHDPVFRALLTDIHYLKLKVIDPTVLYYAQIRSIQLLARDMRSEVFATLPKERRAAIYSSYI